MCEERRRMAAVAATIWALVAGLICIYLVLFGLEAVQRLARPLEEFAYGESWLLDGARRVAQGQGLYGPVDQVPIMHIAYTPLFYVVVGAIQRVIGDHGYTVGRAVSLAATLVGAAALAWSLRRLSGRWWIGLLGAGLFLTQNLTVVLWASLDRSDPLALGLTLIGLAFVTARRDSIAALFFIAAVLTKQTFLIAPTATLIALWPCRRAMVRFAAIFLGGVALAVLIAQVMTNGWFLWHTVTANSNEPDLGTFAVLLGSFLAFNGMPVMAALASLVLPTAPGEHIWPPPVAPGERVWRPPVAPGERVWRLYFLGNLVTLATVAKLGASSNYWLELTAATAALLALAACRLQAWPAARLVAPTLIAGSLFIAIPGYQASATEVGDAFYEFLRPPTPRYLSLVGDTGTAPYRVDAAFVDRIAREPGELLTDNSGLAVAAGKRIAYEFQIFELLYMEGHWSDRPIVEAIEARRFALVALMHPLDGPVVSTRMTPAIQAALQSAYAPDGSEAGFWLYRPR